MATSRLCRACGDWHPIDHSWPEGCFSHFKANYSQSELPRPTVISDSLPGIQSMVSGERFDSKTQLRKHYKANGVTEVGNEISATMKLAAQKPARPAVAKAEVRRAVEQVKQGYRPDLN